MANFRAAPDVYYTEIQNLALTFGRKTSSTGAIDYLPSVSNPYPAPLGTTTQVGQSVSMSSNDTVKVGAAGDRLVGKLIRSAPDALCTVQVAGAMTFSYVAGGGAPVLGGKVSCDGNGGVQADTTSAAGGLVVNLDATNLIATVLIAHI